MPSRIENKVISTLNALRYRFVEPPMLRVLRLKYGAEQFTTITNPLVSIVIPTYNRSKLLVERTLPCLLSQTYRNIEIVVVGDKCIDDTPSVLRHFHDPRVRFFDLPRRTKYPSDPKDGWFVHGCGPYNAGMMLARGLWMFAGSSDDDLVDPTAIEKLLNLAVSGDYELVSGATTRVKDSSLYFSPVIHGPDIKYMNTPIFDVDTLVPDRSIPRVGSSTTWLQRHYLKYFKWNRQAWRKSWHRPAEYDLLARYLAAGVRHGYLSEVLAHIPPVEGQQSSGYSGFLGQYSHT